uniref:Macrophage migration inhibitory factor n=1 Tax=Panagrolaimus davidi TaxID=227884 RepID=A0A914R0D9_9BILA
MPIVKLYTNQKVRDGFAVAFSKFLSILLNKPSFGLFVVVKDQNMMSHDNNADERVCVLEIKAIKIFNNQDNVGYAKGITDYLSKELNCKQEKIVIDFVALNPGFVGRHATTVEVCEPESK